MYNDGDLGVYKHGDSDKKSDIDKGHTATNTAAGGQKMGETLMWNSFTTRGENGTQADTPAGIISFGSYEARNWLNNFESERLADESGWEFRDRAVYAFNAGNNDEYDYKTNGLSPDASEGDKLNNMYRGSQISNGIYVSGRDVGNYAAGAVGRLTHQGKMDFMLTAGGFQLSGNSKASMIFARDYWKAQAQSAGWPAYGEAPDSNFFQRLGYESIRTSQSMKQNETRIWGRKL